MLAALRIGRRLLVPSQLLSNSYSTGAALVMTEFGVPEQVLKLTDHVLPSPTTLGDTEVLINILAVSQFSIAAPTTSHFLFHLF